MSFLEGARTRWRIVGSSYEFPTELMAESCFRVCRVKPCPTVGPRFVRTVSVPDGE